MLNNDNTVYNPPSSKELGRFAKEEESGEVIEERWTPTFHNKYLIPSVRMKLHELGFINFQTMFLVLGGSARIHKLRVDGEISPFLLKLFTKTYADQDEYHSFISSTISSWKSTGHPLSKYLLTYQYYPLGYLDCSQPPKEAPFALMESAIDSPRLDLMFISKNLGTDTLREVREDFLRLMELFDEWGVSHGDLSPDNILVHVDECGKPQIKLIDYEELYLPGFSKSVFTREAGKTTFQHKSRRKGKELDSTTHYFSSIVYYLSLLVYSLQENDPAYAKVYGDFISRIDPVYPEYDGETDEMRAYRLNIIGERMKNIFEWTDAKCLLFKESDLTDKMDETEVKADGKKEELDPFKKLPNYDNREISELAKILEIYIHQETTDHFQSLPYLVKLIRKGVPIDYSMRPGSNIFRK